MPLMPVCPFRAETPTDTGTDIPDFSDSPDAPDAPFPAPNPAPALRAPDFPDPDPDFWESPDFLDLPCCCSGDCGCPSGKPATAMQK
jgi:hypothetical protein